MKDYIQTSHRPIGYQPVHITYRLAGSIPKVVVTRLQRERDERIEYLAGRITSSKSESDRRQWENELKQVETRMRLKIDKFLDDVKTGPFHLQIPSIRKIILESWLFLHEKQAIFVIAICVMGNHVHAIVKASNEVCEAGQR